MISALEALEALREGNLRFVSGVQNCNLMVSEERRLALVLGQAPKAIVLACSDSRVPVELIFDQGLGELFVIRVAGNIASPSQVGSVEFAAEHFGSRLVVVLGHSQCGAVSATLAAMMHPTANHSHSLRAILELIRPAVEPLMATEMRQSPEELLACAIRENIRASANQLRRGSLLLDNLMKRDGLLIVAAEYSLETGRVDFFEGLPERG